MKKKEFFNTLKVAIGQVIFYNIVWEVINDRFENRTLIKKNWFWKTYQYNNPS